MKAYVKSALNPSAYHGKNAKPPFFEGWYFKLVDEKHKETVAIIPGVYLSEKAEDSHAFIQVLQRKSKKVAYVRYPLEKFEAADDVFDIRIGSNRFKADQISLDIDSDDIKCNGELSFSNLSSWPVTVTAPGIMGWYAWVPYMECFHGIVSLDHKIRGSLVINRKEINFTDGRGYTEKDWGRSFPEAWIWMQTNHFSIPGTSFTASAAIIPWINKPFVGFIIGLWHGKTLYRFATYTGSKIKRLNVNEKEIHWVIRDRKFILEIKALRKKGGTLQAPNVEGMKTRIVESLNSEVSIKLFAISKHKRRIIFEDTGLYAGLEADGNLARLIEMLDQ